MLCYVKHLGAMLDWDEVILVPEAAIGKMLGGGLWISFFTCLAGYIMMWQVGRIGDPLLAIGFAAALGAVAISTAQCREDRF